MDKFITLMGMILDFMKRPFTIWGYSFSFWSVFITMALLYIVFWFIGSVFSE